ncbi:BLUF domain-containing protein [Psychrobacter piechaudii]|uniref:Sensors of blue-light using FAD n=1 Tax=Psychrobacter piechaudii TaxID=1945521 RepID=A0A1R4GQC9_9GAMM|nr:BLUF domain-containing protein [Psychrobacter piechaudii]SJM70324.1 Sensors of blue-light using FAD [Psychrobacter piechaudii]
MPLNEHSTATALSKIEDNALVRLVYASSLTFKSRFKPAIFQTVEQDARRYNQQHGITGTLCYGNGQFLQCLEGQKKVLLPLLQEIFDDTRHKEAKILIVQPIEQREFSNWGMRLMFLERWLWSPETKKQADTLSRFLPFKPSQWNKEETEEFLHAIQKIQTPPHVQESGISLNALGNMIQHVVGPHQAFILVQSVLAILTLVAIVLLFRLPFN